MHEYSSISKDILLPRCPPFIPVTRATRGTEESRASAGEPSCRSRHSRSASAAPRSALPRLRTRLAGSATARRRAGARPPPLRLLPCAPLDVGREDRFPLGTRLREDRARVVSGGARAISVPGHAGRSGMGSQAQKRSRQQRASAAAAPPPAAAPLTETNSVPPFSPPPPPPPPRPSPPSPPPSISRRRPSDGAGASLAGAPRRCPPLAAAPSWPPPPLSIPPSAPPLPPPRASPPPPPPSPSPLSGAWRASHRPGRGAHTACAHSLLLCTLTAPPAPPRMQLGAWVSGVSREVAHR